MMQGHCVLRANEVFFWSALSLCYACQQSASSGSSSDPESSQQYVTKSGGEVAANSGSEIAGSSLLIPAGSLGISVNIKMETGADVADESVASNLDLGSNVSIEKSQAAVAVSPSSPTDPVSPFTLSIPLAATQLTTASSYYIVIYKVVVYGENSKVLLGVLPTSALTIAGGVVKVPIKYFGVYQLATASAEITKEVSVETKAPIISKTAASQLPAFQINSVTSEHTASTRKTLFSVDTGTASLHGCTVIVDNDKTAPWSAVVKLGAVPSYTASALENSAHDIYARFYCQDSSGRSAISPWSDGESIAAVATTPATTVSVTYPSALSSFSATIPRGRYSVKLTLTYPATVSDYQSVAIYRASAATAPACGAGTLLTTYTSGFSSTQTYYDVPGSGVHSYRACIVGSGGGTTDTNTTTSAATNADYVAFLTSVKYAGNLSASVNSQTFSTGLAGADYRCQYLADAVGLGGSWRALLGSSATLATARVSPSTSNIVNVSGTLFLNMSGSGFWTQLAAAADTCASAPQFSSVTLDRDESGTVVGSSAELYYWSGTTTNNATSIHHCNNWTDGTASYQGAGGYTGCSSELWIDYNSQPCNTTKRLLCMSAD